MNASNDWKTTSLDTIGAWRGMLKTGKDNQPIDWDWVSRLDMAHGFSAHVDDPVERLAMDRDTAAKVEAILGKTSYAYMRDWKRLIPSYGLPRALAYWNRRLTDEIRTLERELHEDEPVEEKTKPANGAKRPPSPQEWRRQYLPGRDIDKVLGIDIETSGLSPMRDYILDVGFEYMNMRSPLPALTDNHYRYEQTDYEPGDAYGQSRLRFAVPDQCAKLGNPFVKELNGIDVSTLTQRTGLRIFDEWKEAQDGLLQRLIRQPYVAHNATFEHSWFMLNVEGYAEAYRDGYITIIDTLPMSREWDEDKPVSDEHPNGDNTLDGYAKRHGALAESSHERHLGLEDTHIMLVSMKNHLNQLHAEGRGPWGHGGVAGYGGKRNSR